MNSPQQSMQPQVAGDVGAGHVLGRYELLLPIASGGMAMVWAARMKGTRGFQKIVAVKTMLPKLSEDAQFEQMFLDEASLASQIRHPHVVEILDLGEQDGVLYLVMEWVEGVPLNQLMKAAKHSGGIPLPVAVRVVMQACAGLHAAHELRDPTGQLVGLVHRDVSPQNIMVTYDGVTKMVDFGVAKATALGEGRTQAGQVKGKVAYMAPEQVKGGTIDRRVDVFAMGIVLYALTTGKHPFRKESEAATMYNIAGDDPVVPPRRVMPGYPAALERVVMQSLAKDPAKRYPTCNELLRALDQALPASMRASSDEDVGAFVRGLLGDRRDERREALAKALKSADVRAESRVGLKEFLDSQPPPPTSGATPVSSISMLSADMGNLMTAPGTDLTPSGPVTLQPGDLAAQSGQTLASAAVVRTESKKKTRTLLIVGTLGAGLLGVGLAIALSGPSQGEADRATAAAVEEARAVARKAQAEAEAKAEEAARARAEAEAKAKEAAEVKEEAEAEEAAQAAAEAQAKAEEAAKAEEEAKKAAVAARRYIPNAKPKPTPKADPAPAPAPQPGSSWKHDPGF